MTRKRRIRAVFDTNVSLAAHLSKNPNSPTFELLKRWRNGEFELLYSDDILLEIRRKFLEKGISEEITKGYLAELKNKGVWVKVEYSDIKPIIIEDPDDDVIVACAIKGDATHLVTYDPHFKCLGTKYMGITIVDGLHFLYKVRGNKNN